MYIGFGGAGSKLAVNLSEDSIIVNVSQEELDKVVSKNKILAFTSSKKGQLGGSRKNPHIGREAFESISQNLLEIIPGKTIISSSGGGSGSGLTSKVLSILTELGTPKKDEDKSSFVIILPDSEYEAYEYVDNSKVFLEEYLFPAVSSGNTGNIFLLSNEYKFEKKLGEKSYNEMIVKSFKNFYAIPSKSSKLETIEGHIDYEDFNQFCSKSFYNYFTSFSFSFDSDFEKELKKNINPLMVYPQEKWVEVLFLLEIPKGVQETFYYEILDYFNKIRISPVYSIVSNPSLKKPLITLSLLHLNNPVKEHAKLEESSKKKIKEKVENSMGQKSLEKSVGESKIEEEIAKKSGWSKEEVLKIIKRVKS